MSRLTVDEAADWFGTGRPQILNWDRETRRRGDPIWRDLRCAEAQVDLVGLFVWLRVREDRTRREMSARASARQIENWNRDKGDRLPRCPSCTDEDPVGECCFFLRRDYVRAQLGHPYTEHYERSVEWLEATAAIRDHRLTIRLATHGYEPAGGGWHGHPAG